MAETLLREALNSRVDPGGIRRWFEQFELNVLQSTTKAMLIDTMAQDARALQAAREGGVDLNKKHYRDIIGALTDKTEVFTGDSDDPMVLSVLFQMIDPAEVVDELFEGNFANPDDRLDALLCALHAGADLTREQVNELFEDAARCKKYSVIERLFQTGFRPDVQTYRGVVRDRDDSTVKRIRDLTPERVRLALQASPDG